MDTTEEVEQIFTIVGYDSEGGTPSTFGPFITFDEAAKWVKALERDGWHNLELCVWGVLLRKKCENGYPG